MMSKRNAGSPPFFFLRNFFFTLAGPSSPLLNALGLAPPPGRNNPLMSREGIMLVLALHHAPLAFVTLRAGLRSLPADMAEAALTACGAGRPPCTSPVGRCPSWGWSKHRARSSTSPWPGCPAGAEPAGAEPDGTHPYAAAVPDRPDPGGPQ